VDSSLGHDSQLKLCNRFARARIDRFVVSSRHIVVVAVIGYWSLIVGRWSLSLSPLTSLPLLLPDKVHRRIQQIVSWLKSVQGKASRRTKRKTLTKIVNRLSSVCVRVRVCVCLWTMLL